MEAGRRTETYIGSCSGGSLAPQFLNLPAQNLAGVIFGCTHATFKECLRDMLFGLPYQHFAYVENVKPGLPLFLFNYSDKKLHGVFEADSEGKININPYAWNVDDKGKTPYPAQVRVRLRQWFQPLSEIVYKSAIADNYYTENHFFFELNHLQTENLLELFRGASTVQTHVPSPRRTKSQKQEVDAEGWSIVKKSTRAVLDAWDKAEPFVPATQRGDGTCDAMPENWEEAYEGDGCSQVYEGDGMGQNVLLQNSEKQLKNGHEKELLDHLKFLKLQDSVQNTVGKQSDRFIERQECTEQGLIQPQGYDEENGTVKQLDGEECSTSLLDWERAARERCLQEQAMLKDERERLKESLQCMDASVAKAVQKNLEICANAIAQIRQDRIELKHAIDEVKMYFEWREEIEKLWRRNAMLENTQMQLTSEIEMLKREMNTMALQLTVLLQGGRAQDVGTSSSVEKLRVGDKWKTNSPADIEKVFLLGGHNNDVWLRTVDVFCPVTHTLSSAPPMLSVRSYAAATVLMGLVYVFGGGNGESWYSTVETYDSSTERWSICPPMSFERGSLGGTTLGDRIFALGGGNNGNSFDDVEFYDPHIGAWISSTSMLSKRFGVATVTVNGAVYAIGGYNGNMYLRSAERFDPREALWTSVAQMRCKRGSLSAAVLEGKIYAVGGYDGTEFLDSVEVYEPRTNSWLQMESKMHKKRAYGAIAAAGNKLYMFGGFHGGPFIHEVECFSERDGWKILDEIVMGKRCFLSGAVL